MMKRTPPLIVLVLVQSMALRAHAEPPAAPDTSEPASVSEAREAFLTGAALAKRGQWPEALAAFERSRSLHSHPVTTYNIGYCERALGHSTRARERFREALAADAGLMPDGMRKEAESHLEEADRRIVRVIVVLEGGVAPLAVDGRPLQVTTEPSSLPILVAATRDEGPPESPPSAKFELQLDPGRHVLVASRPRVADVVRTLDYSAGSRSELRLVLTLSGANGTPAPTQNARSLEPREKLSAPSRVGPIAAYGVGAAGLAVGIVFGIRTLDRKSELDDVCGADGKTCPPGSEADQRAVRRDAAISTIGFGVALAGAAIGTFLLVTAPSNGPSAKRIRPWIGIGPAGVRGAF